MESVDFGGSGPTLHFAHANGYTPGAYAPLIATLTPRYRVISSPLRPLWPENSRKPNEINDWSPLADDLIAFLDERGEKNIIGAGHSIGGVITLLAALRRPELFRAVAMIDPVLFPYSFLFAWLIIDGLNLVQYAHPLIPATLRRQCVFESAAEVYESYRRKPVFARMSDENLHACAEALVRPRPDGKVELIYPTDWEARIYSIGPRVDWLVWRELRKLRAPLLVVRGSEREAGWPDATEGIRKRLPHAEIRFVEGGGHLAPLEKPKEVGGVIQSFLERAA